MLVFLVGNLIKFGFEPKIGLQISVIQNWIVIIAQQ
jgi:hypothetical protein